MAVILEKSKIDMSLAFPELNVSLSGDRDEVTQSRESRAVDWRPGWSKAAVLRLASLACTC